MNETQSIQLSLSAAKDLHNRGQALGRLLKNKDFQLIIEQGYFKENPVRLVNLLTDPGMQSPEAQAGIMREMHGISSLRDYLRMIDRSTDGVDQAIEDHERELELLTAGDEESEGEE